MLINRFASEEIKNLMSDFPAVAITGPRQVGKTTLALQLKKNLAKPAIYLDLENEEDLSKLRQPALFFDTFQDHLIILDEIQRMPKLFPVLRSVIDRQRQPGRFLLLGSASPDLIRDASETLAGRIAYKELTPFHYLEIPAEISWQEHWNRGGFPLSTLASNNSKSFTWRKNFVQTYIERHLPMLGLSADKSTIRKFWTMLAHFHGSIWNSQNFSKSLEISSPTVKRYLHFLEDAFLITILPSFHFNIKKRLVKSPKVYISDSGILHYLLGLPDFASVQGHPVLGVSWEGFVLSQIKAVLPDFYEAAFYRTREGAEVDLVLLRGGYPEIAIEVKYTNAPKLTKGFLNAVEDLKTTKNFFITPSSDHFPLSQNVTACSIARFLEILTAIQQGKKDSL